jgi:hypothetical protein
LPASSRHATRIADAIEQFGVFELALPSGDGSSGQPEARMKAGNLCHP